VHISLKRLQLLAASLVLTILPLNARAAPVNNVAAEYSWGNWRNYLSYLNHLPRAHYPGAKPHHKRRHTRHGDVQVNYATQIEHVVVIVMENRTMDNLFDGFYGTSYPGGGTFGDSAHLDLCNPGNTAQCGGYGPLSQYNLFCPSTPCQTPGPDTAQIDPKHYHETSFWDEAQDWNLGNIVFQDGTGYEAFGCPGSCSGATALSYVNPGQSWPYATLFAGPYNPTSNTFAGGSVGAIAANVLQSNEGPSFVAHQYLISGQSGGYDLRSPYPGTAPYAMAENPGYNGINQFPPPPGDTDTTGTYPDEEDPSTAYMGCGSPRKEATLDMQEDYKDAESSEKMGAGLLSSACSEYPTIFDEAAGAGFSWEYIAHSNTSIWAAPLGVRHLFSQIQNGTQTSIGYQRDPDAEKFVQNLYTPLSSGGYPELPNITFITPCVFSSDHPNPQGQDKGPGWLAWIINEIAGSPNPVNWQNTVFLVTWDDWGGWFDSYQPKEVQPGQDPWPYHPQQNAYNIPLDANEWGFRVPLIVISPYVNSAGFVSNAASNVGVARSQGGMLSFIEDTFGLARLGTDDSVNVSPPPNSSFSDLHDMINLNNQPLPYVPLNTQGFSPSCSS
jgi:phospholipase C